ncbi:hypothetical protein HYS29_00225 [Candidatus Microgenomates bacterium]|nr:hypothetical protein [Candidatus Microgenomates bacterium]
MYTTFVLNNFDPISFLNINVALLLPKEVISLRTSLNAKIGEYVLLKLSGFLTQEQLDQIINLSNGQEMIDRLKASIPKIDKRIIRELENFKKDFQVAERGMQNA